MQRIVTTEASQVTGAAPVSGPRALVFNIQRYSIHDGPGIRTTVFLKGCPLRCQWCHNPEAISGRMEFGFLPERCIGCQECVAACPWGVHHMEGGQHTVRRELCQGEGRCVEVCYAEALERLGYYLTVDEAVERAERDRTFYESSGGGVTISGGEPLQQPEFTLAFLAHCRERGLHTALDTCGHGSWKALEAAARTADLVLYDLKQMNAGIHRRVTGVSNRAILQNLARLLHMEGRGEVWIRYPLIPGVNDTLENSRAMGEFLQPYAVDRPLRVDILPYHQLGESKYRKLGLEYPMGKSGPPEPATIEEARRILASYGLDAHTDN
jgi:glycyl-radical enzyme activating protein